MRRTAAHVFVESLDSPSLADDDVHHLVRVLRLRAGEAVSVSDGQWSWRLCRFTGSGIEPAGEVVRRQPLEPAITIGFALPKADRPEWIVQKLTEIGVERIVILTADRSITRWEGGRVERNLSRLRTVARQAAMQSRRISLPELCGPITLGAAVASSTAEALVSLAEPDGHAITARTSAIMVGPEGGWTPAELAESKSHIGLGDGILRVETAALVAATRLIALREGQRRPGLG